MVDNGIAAAAGVPANRMPTRTMKGHAGPLVNDSALVESLRPGVVALLGEGKVAGNFPTVTGSEDFQEAFAPLNTPYVFLLIGVAPPERVAAAQKQGRLFPYSNHNLDFFVERPAVTLGAQLNTVAALALLGSKP